MAWKTRDEQKRKLGAISSGIDRDLQTLKSFCEMYEKEHKQLADYATSIASALVMTQTHINVLKDQF